MRFVKDFYELDAWKISMEMTLKIYRLTKQFPAEEKFGIVSQLQRASTSIMANIAEGFERYHTKDKIRFYYQARGSVAEVQNFLLLCLKLNYLSENLFNETFEYTKQIGRLINGLIKFLLNNNQVPGDKYRVPSLQ